MLTKTTITPYQPNGTLEVSSGPFALNQALTVEILGHEFDQTQAIPDGRTGRLIYPAQTQMDLVMAAFDRQVDFSMFKSVSTQRIHRFHWNTHVNVDQQIRIQHRIVRYESLLGCFNVWWSGEMVDDQTNSVLCSYQRCQRWYNV